MALSTSLFLRRERAEANRGVSRLGPHSRPATSMQATTRKSPCGLPPWGGARWRTEVPPGCDAFWEHV